MTKLNVEGKIDSNFLTTEIIVKADLKYKKNGNKLPEVNENNNNAVLSNINNNVTSNPAPDRAVSKARLIEEIPFPW